MSARMGPTSATTTQSVTTPWAHTAARARRDSLEMVSTAQVTHTLQTAFIFTCWGSVQRGDQSDCAWPQTATSARRTATCVRAATAWTCREATAASATWALSPPLTGRPAMVRQWEEWVEVPVWMPAFTASKGVCPHRSVRIGLDYRCHHIWAPPQTHRRFRLLRTTSCLFSCLEAGRLLPLQTACVKLQLGDEEQLQLLLG